MKRLKINQRKESLTGKKLPKEKHKDKNYTDNTENPRLIGHYKMCNTHITGIPIPIGEWTESYLKE